jgi:hypothetical protein
MMEHCLPDKVPDVYTAEGKQYRQDGEVPRSGQDEGEKVDNGVGGVLVPRVPCQGDCVLQKSLPSARKELVLCCWMIERGGRAALLSTMDVVLKPYCLRRT